MLKWEQVKPSPHDLHKRVTLVARNSFRYFPPDLSEFGELREKEGSLWINTPRFFISERIHNPHDDSPYRYILIVNGCLHYYTRTIEEAKAISEVINDDLQKIMNER